jgi:hypothetical protein
MAQSYRKGSCQEKEINSGEQVSKYFYSIITIKIWCTLYIPCKDVIHYCQEEIDFLRKAT